MHRPAAMLLLLVALPLSAQVSQLPANAIVPVVSSTPGASGARFRTELQLGNPTDRAMGGWLLLRPQLIAVRYDLAAHTTKVWADFVADIGGEGAGSLDLVLDSNTDLPTVAARSFDDQPGGTNGVSVPLLPIDAVLRSNDIAALIAPRDPANFRFNIGLRALETGAEIEFVVRDRAGTEKRRISLPLGAHQFLQKSAAELLGLTLAASDLVEVTMVSGAAIVYGSTVDNRTNDAALQVLRRQ